MQTGLRTLLIVGSVGLGLTVTNAQATPITYDFTVTATNGPLAGVTSKGSFSYDSSIVPPGGGSVGATNLLTSLHFVWDGITYNAATANTGSLGFDSTGALFNAEFGTNCTAGGCGIASGFEQWGISATVLQVTGGFGYALSSVPLGQFEGNATLKKVAVPEPASLSLFTVGIAGLGLLRWRRAR